MKDIDLQVKIKDIRKAIEKFAAEIKAALRNYDFKKGEYIFRGNREEEIALEEKVKLVKENFLKEVEPLSVAITTGNFNRNIKQASDKIMNKCINLYNTPTIPTTYRRALEGERMLGLFRSDPLLPEMKEELNKLVILLNTQ